jgi:hypothetical protein
MTLIYRWYIFNEGVLTQPPAYRDQYKKLYVLVDYYKEYEAIQALDDYLQWDCPHRNADFVLQKIYQK